MRIAAKLLLAVALLLCVGCAVGGRLSVGFWGVSVSYEWQGSLDPVEDGDADKEIEHGE